MPKFHLIIKIYNDFFEEKLNNNGKIYSVWFDDYDILVEKIFHDMSLKEINNFRLCLFNLYRSELKCCRVSKFINGDVFDGYMIPAYTFEVSSHNIAVSIPRKIRDKYFDYDCLRERYYVKPDFIFYLKS